MLDDCWTAAQQARNVIYYTMLCLPAWYIVEKLQIPAMMASVMPNMSPTWQFPAIGRRRSPWAASAIG